MKKIFFVRKNDRTFVTKIQEMPRKKKNTEKEHDFSTESDTFLVQEPAAQYGDVVTTTAMHTMNMMGMNRKTDYNRIKSDSDYITMIRTGIPKGSMDYLMEVTNISLTEMAHIVHTSDRTLRRYRPEEKLPQEQSERLVELAGLYAQGQEVFGSLENFKEWMDTILIPLGNKKPKDFLDTSLGIRLLHDELGRIEHGIFA